MERHSGPRGQALAFLMFLWLVWFLNFSLRSLFSPILPLIEDEFLISHARASSVFLFISAGYALSMFLSGIFAGRIGLKRTILFSLYISSAVCFCVPFVKAFSVLYVLGSILGFSIGLYLPAAIPMITERFAEANWARSIAIHDSGASISIFTTPLIALFLLHFMQWRGIFGVLAVVCLVCAAVFHVTGKEIRIHDSGNRTIGGIVRTRYFWFMTLLWIFAAGANIGIYLIVPLYLTKELAFSMHYADTILGISRLGGAAVGLLCGFLADRFHLRRMMFFMLIAAGVCTVGMGVVPAGAMAAMLLLQAIFVTGFFPLSMIFVTKAFGREERGMAMGFMMTLSIIFGGGLIPYFLGLSGDLVSFRFGITVLGFMVILSSWLLFLLKDKK
jgi:MFS family permease